MTPTRMRDDRQVIVIGSGPSGTAAALALLRQGIPVTMLESGQGFPTGLLVRAMGRNVFRRRPHLELPQRQPSSDGADAESTACWYHDLVPGGLSNYWTGAVPRFAPEDFSEGERLHERYRWPLSYADLAPYYEQVERLLVVVGDARDVPNLPASRVAYARQLPRRWQRVAVSARAFGQGFTTLPLADGPPWMVQRTGTAFNSFTRIVPLLRRYRHFHLIRGAHAVRLEWDGARRKVRSVLYVDRTTRTECQIYGAAVVVAAGALASTKLLLDSACADYPNGLGDTEGILGRYLHDHSHHWCIMDLSRGLPRLVPAAYLTRAPYCSSAPLSAAQCTIGMSSESLGEKVLSFTPAPTHSFGALFFGTMVPLHQNHVRLDPSAKDEFGRPMLDIQLQYDATVPQTLEAARQRLLAIMDAAGYQGTLRQPLPHLMPGTSVHYGGTVRMHQSPRHGMLNAWNRLHSIDNVVVADASCFTTGVEKNPVPTAMALAARAADRLAADLRSGS